MALQHLRSGTADKRPIPTAMSAGQIAINTNQASPGLFFKDSNGDLVKVGPVHIGTDAPNSTPASTAATALVSGTVYQILTAGTTDFTQVGAADNNVGTVFTATGAGTGTGTVSGQQGVEKGEQWLDTTGGTYVLKIYDGTGWRSETGTFVDVAGDNMTGNLTLGTDKVVLNATSGAATFVDYVTSNEGFYVSQTDTPAGNSIFKSWKGSDTYVDILDNGSATLRSTTFKHGSPSTGTCKFTINPENNSQVTLAYDDEGSVVFGTSSDPATQADFSSKLTLTSTGNAEFAGSACIGGTTITDSNILNIQGSSASKNIGVVLNDTNTSKIYGIQNTGSNFKVFDYTASQNRFTITSTGAAEFGGRLLVGTTTEGYASADNFTVADSGNCGVTIRSGTSNLGTIAFSDATSGAGEYAGYIQYSQASAYMAFATNEDERLRITSGGNVQIGNTTASAHGDRVLQIGDTSRSATYVEVRTSTSGSSGVLFSDGTAGDNSGYRGTIEYAHNNDSLVFKTAAVDRLTLTSTGNAEFGGSVSIAANNSLTFGNYTSTTASSVKIWNNNSYGLYVNGTGDSTHTAFGIYKVNDTEGNPSGYKARIFHDGSASLATSNLDIDATGQLTIKKSTPYTDGSGNRIASFRILDRPNSTANGVLMYENGDAVFAGKVSIGTTTLDEILHVAAASEAVDERDGVLLESTSSLAADTGLPLVFTSNIGTQSNYGVASIAGRKENATSGEAGGYLQFATGNTAGAISEAMRITSSGLIGINETNPGHYIDMNIGSTNIGIKMTSTDAGSYMQFADNDTTGETRIGAFENNFKIDVNDDERVRVDENGLISAYGSGNTTNLKLRNTASAHTSIFFAQYYQGASSTTSGGTQKFAVATNGGISNVQSNNVDLCDEREKKNIVGLETKWDKVKSWELKKFHYNEDADTDDLRYGVIAQQIETVCPEVLADWHKQSAEDAVLDEDGNVITPAVSEVIRKGVKEQQMMWMAIKALQEAQARIETLEAKVAALE